MSIDTEKQQEGRTNRNRRGWVWLALCILAGGFILGSVLLLLGASGFPQYATELNPDLPKLRLRSGAEFRVVKIEYGNRHRHGRAPELAFRLWNHLPSWLQSKVPYPEEGTSFTTRAPSVTIWWTWIDPKTKKPALVETGPGEVVFDSGVTERLRPESFSAGDFRPLLIVDPPQNSRHLTVRIPVDGELVRFQIPNPAYKE